MAAPPEQSNLDESANGGGGDAPQRRRHRHLKLYKLPVIVRYHIYDHLDRRSINSLRLTHKFLQDELELDYGLHIILPPRGPTDFGQPFTQTITDEMLANIILSMEGKVIRSLDMCEMPPMFPHFPFDRFIQYPNLLREVSLKYVDVILVYTILSRCRGLVKFSYKSGIVRQIRGMTRSYLEPIPVPPVSQTLSRIVAVLPDLEPLRRLSTLSLCIQYISSDNQHNSDWTNVLYILLSFPTGQSLKNFEFQFNIGTIPNIGEHLLLLSCVMELLRKSPNLRKYQFRSMPHSQINMNIFSLNVAAQAMIQRFGSDFLKQIYQSNSIPQRLRLAEEFTRHVGHSLNRLEEIQLHPYHPLHMDFFRSFIHNLSAARNITVGVGFVTGIEINALSQSFQNLIMPHVNAPVCQAVREIYLARGQGSSYWDFHGIPRLDLTNILETYTNLNKLEIDQKRGRQLRRWENIEAQRNFVEVEGPADDDETRSSIVIREIREHTEFPEVTIRQVEEHRRSIIFQQVTVLKLTDTTLLARDAAKLTYFTNVKCLQIVIPARLNHRLYGIHVTDLWKLLHLRKLNSLFVGNVLLPLDQQESQHLRVELANIGVLRIRLSFGGWEVFFALEMDLPALF